MIKNILWDFDGLILDSMPVREYGFKKIFENYEKVLVDKLLEYHNKNCGLSRFVKIKYFYEELLHSTVSTEEISILADKFSNIMRKELTKKEYLIRDSIEFIKENYKNYNFHIVSGSDENELIFLCKELGILDYFISISGSPRPKNELVQKIIKDYKYKKNETILIGDSINDYEAAKINNIDFYGFNNKNISNVSKTYINCFKDFVVFDYGVGEITHSKENKTFLNLENSVDGIVDYLLFFDSRGMTINNGEYEDTNLKKLILKIEKMKKTYIAVSRPKNIMIFATLLNFLELNPNYKFNYLITNIGFVDFTPKKYTFIEDMKEQIGSLSHCNVKIQKLSKYILSNGNSESLYTLKYTNKYLEYIVTKLEEFKFKKKYFINTSVIKSDIKIDRVRPDEFFNQLSITNKAIEYIGLNKNNEIIDVKDIFIKNELIHTYDAVHFTKLGHELIFNEISFRMDMTNVRG